MEREVKFRIIYKNQVYGYEKLTETGWQWMCLEFNPPNHERWTNGVFPRDSKLKRNQFTGLLDKNGTEIYEGDILDFDAKEWGKEGFVSSVEWDKQEASWSFGGGLPYDLAEYRQVIGNIFQHPELLK